MKKQKVSEIAPEIRKQYFPLKLKNGITCEVSDRETVLGFIQKNFKKVFPVSYEHFELKQTSRQSKKLQACIEEFKAIHKEYFVFKQRGKIIGWSYGEIDDFETFYMRNTGIFPKYQDKGIYSAFLSCFLEYIEALGYQRVSSQHHPDNQRVLNIKLKHGFIISGTENHERWGHLLKMVKIFDKKREQFFKRKFL